MARNNVFKYVCSGKYSCHIKILQTPLKFKLNYLRYSHQSQSINFALCLDLLIGKIMFLIMRLIQILDIS